MSTSHSAPGSTRSRSTSRLPDATTPMIAASFSPDRRRFAACRNFSVSMVRVSYQLRNLFGGSYRLPDQCIRSSIDCAASMLRCASSGLMPRSSGDRKSTRLNSSHDQISYAVFCLKKKIQTQFGKRDVVIVDEYVRGE